MEQWKDVIGYKGIYQVSDEGRIRSCDRVVYISPCKRYPNGHEKKLSGRILKAWDSRGYKHVNLHKDGVSKQVQVHRIVASAFVANTDNKPQVNHINGDKADNRAVNLEWVTQKENTIHASAVLGHISRKLTDEQIRTIREDSRSSRKIAADYGVSHTTVNDIKRGRFFEYVR